MDYRGESSSCFILKKRVDSKRNIACWIELFHAIVVVVFLNGRIRSHRWQQRRMMRGKRRSIKKEDHWTVYTSGYCIRIYYNLRNPEEKIPRVTLRALRTGSKRLIDGGKRRRETEEEGSFPMRRENILSKQKQKVNLLSYERR